MKRDMDLCREILRQIKAHPYPLHADEPKINGRQQDEVLYHLVLLCEAGLIWSEFPDLQSRYVEPRPRKPVVMPRQDLGSRNRYRLTWQGHEFLDAASNDTIWRKAKEKVLSTAGGLTFEVLKAALLAEISEVTGLDL